MMDRPLFAIFRLEISIPSRMKRLRRQHPASAKTLQKGTDQWKANKPSNLPWPTALMQPEEGLANILRHPLNSPRRSKVNCPIARQVKIGFSLEEESNTLGSSFTLPNYSLWQVRSIIVCSRVLPPNGQLIPATGCEPVLM